MQAHDHAANNDAILLIVIPATSCREVAASKALKLAQELDSDGPRSCLISFEFTISACQIPFCFSFGLANLQSLVRSDLLSLCSV